MHLSARIRCAAESVRSLRIHSAISRMPFGPIPRTMRPVMSGAAKTVLAFLVGRPLVAILLAALVVGVLLLHAHRQKTPVTHRVQHVTLSDAQQMQLGSEEYAKTLRANRARIVSSGPQYAEVQRVARRIEAVARRDKPNFVWRVTLIRKREANAYCLLGGGSGLPFSRSQESEADHIGLIYMSRAGYDPHQAVAFWKRMLRASKGQEPPEFLSDHPSDAHRVERVEGWLPQAEREYRSRT